MLCLFCRYLGNGTKDVGTVDSCSLQTVSMINLSITSLFVNIKIRKVVVKVQIGSTEVPPEKGSMSGEQGGYLRLLHSQQYQPHPSQPLVELCHHQRVWTRDTGTEFRYEPADQVPQN